MVSAAEPGWYDDGTGRQRWWDGARWTDDYADFSSPQVELHSGTSPVGNDDEYGGIVVDARWIRCGTLSQPIGGVVAVVATTIELGKRPAVTAARHSRTLFSAHGAVTPRQFGRLDGRSLHLAIECAGQVWLAPVAPHDEARARRFASWVNASAAHYRYG
jgi:hypothetical protein